MTEGIDIQSILPSDQTIESGKLLLFVIDTSRATVGQYQWQPKTVIVPGVLEFPAGWYDLSTTELAVKKFNYGEGFQVKCDVPVSLVYAGQVMTAAPKFAVEAAGYYRCGNITPVEVDIQNIIPSTTKAAEIETGKVLLITYGSDRATKGQYQWQPKTVIVPGVIEFPAGWYDLSTTELAVKKFAAGDGFVLKTDYADCTLTFPNPVGE